MAFSFFADNYEVLDENIAFEDMQERYPDSYLIVMNAHVEGRRPHGDIVAILTAKEYYALEIPASIAPKFGVVEGISIFTRRAGGLLGSYL